MKITNMSQVTTKLGDKGYSSNYVQQKYRKDNILFDVLGTNDELSSLLGLTYHYAHYEPILEFQKALQSMNTLIATNPDADHPNTKLIQSFGEEALKFLEDEEQRLLKEHPIEARFVLPGSEATLPGAYFDLSRAVCRRAERKIVKYIHESERQDLWLALKYINRLSDLLFILARSA
jgi:cob(I)alamin adenosyltransferase